MRVPQPLVRISVILPSYSSYYVSFCLLSSALLFPSFLSSVLRRQDYWMEGSWERRYPRFRTRPQHPGRSMSSKSELDNRISWNAEWCYAVAWYAALHCYLSSQFMFYVFSYHYFDTDAQSSMEQTYTRMAGEVHVLTHRPVTHGHLLHFGFLARLISRFFSLFHVDPAYDQHWETN